MSVCLLGLYLEKMDTADETHPLCALVWNLFCTHCGSIIPFGFGHNWKYGGTNERQQYTH